MKIRKGDIEIEIDDGNSNEALAIISALQSNGKRTGTKRVRLVRELPPSSGLLNPVPDVRAEHSLHVAATPRAISTRGSQAAKLAEGVPVLASDHPLGFILLRALMESKAGSIHGFKTMKRLGVVQHARGMGTLAKDLRALAHDAGIDPKTVYYNKHTSGQYFLLEGGADLFHKVSAS